MSAQSASNVVAFASVNQTAPADGGPTVESLRLLRACRDRLVQGATAAFAEGLAQAQEDLLDLADRATKLDTQHLYFVGQRLLASRGQELLQELRGRFIEGFEQGVEELRRGPQSRSGPEPGGLQLGLVDCEDFERDLAIGKLASRAAYNCSQQLTALDRRVGVLLGGARVNADDNPLHPRALFGAFLAAVQAMGVEGELDLILLQQFEQRTGKKLPGVYAAVNRHLAENDILPDIPIGGEEPAARLETQAQAAAGPVVRGDASPSSQTAARPSQGSSAPPAAATEGAAGAPGGPAPGQDDDLVSRLLAGLQSLGAAYPAVAAGAPESAPPSPQSQARLLETLTGLQKATPGLGPGARAGRPEPGSAELLHRLRAEPSPEWSHPVDAMTLDIVAMLFDLIFDDPKVPPALHAEIGKLQVPVLKLALIDKGFFSNKRHPARRLLETIANAAAGLGKAAEPRLVAKVKAVVDSIVRGFDTDTQIFAVQAERLAEFVADEARRGGDRGRDFDESDGGAAAEERARALAEEEVRPRAEDPTLPGVVRDFIAGAWRAVLVQVGGESGTSSAAWKEAVATMDELAWSVQPKSDQAERQRLLAALPGLLERLQQGLRAVERLDEWSEFFGALMDYHMRASRGQPGPCEAPAATRSEPRPVAGSGVGTGQPRSAPRPEAEASAQSPEAAAEDRHMRLARNLALGTWVEFRSARGRRKTLRLSWVSGMRGVYLFTNAEGENGMTIAVARLAEYFRRGMARLVEQ